MVRDVFVVLGYICAFSSPLVVSSFLTDEQSGSLIWAITTLTNQREVHDDWDGVTGRFRYNVGRMACAECQAFLSNYTSASERYAALVLMLETMAEAENFADPAFLKLKNEVEAARIDCVQAKEALRVH
jgi:hypothetical protein